MQVIYQRDMEEEDDGILNHTVSANRPLLKSLMRVNVNPFLP